MKSEGKRRKFGKNLETKVEEKGDNFDHTLRISRIYPNILRARKNRREIGKEEKEEKLSRK